MRAWDELCAGTVAVMSMSQLVIGSALGFVIAQTALYAVRQGAGWLQRDELRRRRGKLTPARWSSFLGGFIKYAGPLAAGAAVITLGVWALGDYLAARSARGAALASTFDAPAPAPSPLPTPRSSANEAVAVADARAADAATIEGVDPYADAAFKVQRRSHRADAAGSLKDALLQRSEVKARAELLSETQQHVHRSQYDCETADRAARYLKAGLDVWGFAAWEEKYFPTRSYRGATLAQCQDIDTVLDPGSLDLQATVAQHKQP